MASTQICRELSLFIERTIPGMEEDYEMHSLKRQFLSSRNAMVVVATGLLLGLRSFQKPGSCTSRVGIDEVFFQR
jgi:hypothetical protein